MNIYLFRKMRFSHFKFNFLKFQQLRKTYVTYTLCHIFVIVTQWLAQRNSSQQFQQKKIHFFSETFCKLYCAKHPVIGRVLECSLQTILDRAKMV